MDSFIFKEDTRQAYLRIGDIAGESQRMVEMETDLDLYGDIKGEAGDGLVAIWGTNGTAVWGTDGVALELGDALVTFEDHSFG